MPPKNPKTRDVWTNSTGRTVGVVNPGETAIWTGYAWVPLFGRDPASIKLN